MVKKCLRYERPTSNHKLNFPAQIFHSKVFYFFFVLGRSYLGHFSPHLFTFRGSILLLVFRFLWLVVTKAFFLTWKRDSSNTFSTSWPGHQQVFHPSARVLENFFSIAVRVTG
jgi:hypothetical protein